MANASFQLDSSRYSIPVPLGLARMVRLTLADVMASARELACWLSLCACATAAQSPHRCAVQINSNVAPHTQQIRRVRGPGIRSGRSVCHSVAGGTLLKPVAILGPRHSRVTHPRGRAEPHYRWCTRGVSFAVETGSLSKWRPSRPSTSPPPRAG